jgi:cell division protein FtsL
VSFHRYFLSKRVGNEQLVREVDRKRHRELLMVILTALALALAVLAYAWQHFEMIRIGYEMEEFRVERVRLLKFHSQLALERAALTSPDRVEAVATRRLGMIYPSASQVVIIEPYEKGQGRRSGLYESRGIRVHRDRFPSNPAPN